MLSHLKKSKGAKGFTIIEVLIVLAIAGLILLIVFLAVPALQRNSRNTQRNNDISSLIGAMSEYINNNAGVIPTSCTGATPCPFIANAKLGFYKADSATNFIFTNNTAAAAITNPNNGDNIAAASFSTCSGNTAVATNASSRSIAVVYNVETGGGGLQQQCKTAQ